MLEQTTDTEIFVVEETECRYLPRTINKLIKDGWKVDSFHVGSLNGNSTFIAFLYKNPS